MREQERIETYLKEASLQKLKFDAAYIKQLSYFAKLEKFKKQGKLSKEQIEELKKLRVNLISAGKDIGNYANISQHRLENGEYD